MSNRWNHAMKMAEYPHALAVIEEKLSPEVQKLIDFNLKAFDEDTLMDVEVVIAKLILALEMEKNGELTQS